MLFRSSTHSDPVALTNLRRNVRSVLLRAGLRDQALDEMEIAVGEVLSNVHRHAYQGETGPMSVAVSRHADRVSVVITDRGRATEAPEVPLRPRGGAGGGISRKSLCRPCADTSE
jgi:anti-sigma regulatory factor (Ser/Thr protein kinase)